MRDLERLQRMQESPIKEFLIALINADGKEYLKDADCSENDTLLSEIECSIDLTGIDPNGTEFPDEIADRKLITPIPCEFSYNEIITFMQDNNLMP